MSKGYQVQLVSDDDHLRVLTSPIGDDRMHGTWEHFEKIDLEPYDELAIEWENNPAEIGRNTFSGYGSQFGEVYAGDNGDKIQR